MTTMNDHAKNSLSRPKYFFLSHPRTGSVLLMRMLSHQPRLTQGEYFITSKIDMMLEGDFTSTNINPQKQKYLPRVQEAFDRLQDYVAAFEQGKDKFKELYASQAKQLASGGNILIFKEHVMMLWDPSIEAEQTFTIPQPHQWTLRLQGLLKPPDIKTNPTMFPDEFFDSWKPFMLIRHPALTFPSFFRACKKAFGTSITHPWVVQGNSYRMDCIMFDWWKKRLGADASSSIGCNWPLVLDMHDMVNSPSTMEKFCLALELDAKFLRYEWNSAPKEYAENQKAHIQVFLSSIQASERVLAEKAPQSVSLDAEYLKWIEEWGVHDADVLKKQVEDSMNDYEYLWSRRIVA